MIEISDDSLIRCPWCQGEMKAIDWDTKTYGACISREMKRAFKSVKDRKVWGKESKHYYMCPDCSMWSRGNQLKLIDDSGNVIRGIGGQPIIRTLNKNN